MRYLTVQSPEPDCVRHVLIGRPVAARGGQSPAAWADLPYHLPRTDVAITLWSLRRLVRLTAASVLH